MAHGLRLVGVALCLGWSSLEQVVLAQVESTAFPVPSTEVLEAQNRRIQAIQKATKSTIGVFGTDGQGGGSGVIVTPDGYALTNFHVTQPFGDRMRAGLSNGEMVEAIIVGIDPTGDLALIKLQGQRDFPAAVIADSDRVRTGQWCFAAGNPFVLATNLQPTVTWGIVSGVHRYQYPSGTILEYTDCIQTDAAINPGNSGGPLYNMDGDLIGINGRCSFEKRGRVNVGVGYAISINQAMLFLGHLKSGRIVDHATLGFTVSSDGGKVVVSNILEDSDAYRRGLRYGDEVLMLDGREISSVNQLKNILGIHPTHARLALSFRQEGQIVDTWIRVIPLHTIDELEEIVGSDMMGGPPAPPEGEEAKNRDNDSQDSLLETLFEKRRGFANFHFNRVELDRVDKLKPLITHPLLQDKRETEFEWNWKGKFAGESTTFAMRSTTGNIESHIGSETVSIDRQAGWSELVKSKSMHSIGLGLRLWHAWQATDARQLGEAIYLGTVRSIDSSDFVDLTQVTVGEVEAFFYSDSRDGRLLRLELESDPNLDRAEVQFDRYQENEGLNQPSLMKVGFGPEPKWIVELEPAMVTSGERGDR